MDESVSCFFWISLDEPTSIYQLRQMLDHTVTTDLPPA